MLKHQPHLNGLGFPLPVMQLHGLGTNPQWLYQIQEQHQSNPDPSDVPPIYERIHTIPGLGPFEPNAETGAFQKIQCDRQLMLLAILSASMDNTHIEEPTIEWKFSTIAGALSLNRVHPPKWFSRTSHTHTFKYNWAYRATKSNPNPPPSTIRHDELALFEDMEPSTLGFLGSPVQFYATLMVFPGTLLWVESDLVAQGAEGLQWILTLLHLNHFN